MIQQNKKYIAYGIVILTLVAAIFILSVKKKDEPTKINDESVCLYSIEEDNIKNISVSNQNDEYSFSFENGISLVGKQNIKIDEYKVNSLKSEAKEIIAERTVSENTADLSEYGLDNPIALIRTESKDDKIFIVYLGNETPTKDGRYVKFNDEKTVYILPSYKCEPIMRKLGYYRVGEVIETEFDNVDEIILEESDRKIRFVRKNKNVTSDKPNNIFAAFEMTMPYHCDAESNEIKKIVDAVNGIEIIDFVEDGEDNYSSYGLSPYYGKITLIENNGKKNTVTLGTDKDGKFYALINDSKTVYTISNKDFSFVNADATSFIQSLAYLRNIDTVSKIVYTHDSIKAIFEIKKVDEDNYDIKYNGKNISAADFKKAYSELIGINIAGPVTFNPTGKPLVSYEFHFNDGTLDYVNYYSIDERKAALSINGKIQFYTNKTELYEHIDIVDEYIKKL